MCTAQLKFEVVVDIPKQVGMERHFALQPSKDIIGEGGPCMLQSSPPWWRHHAVLFAVRDVVTTSDSNSQIIAVQKSAENKSHNKKYKVKRAFIRACEWEHLYYFGYPESIMKGQSRVQDSINTIAANDAARGTSLEVKYRL